MLTRLVVLAYCSACPSLCGNSDRRRPAQRQQRRWTTRPADSSPQENRCTRRWRPVLRLSQATLIFSAHCVSTFWPRLRARSLVQLFWPHGWISLRRWPTRLPCRRSPCAGRRRRRQAAAASAAVAAVAAAAAAAPLVLRCAANTLLLGYAAASFFCSTRCSRSQQCRAFRRLAYPPDCRQGRARWRSFCSRTCLTPDRCSGPHQRPALQAGRCLPVQRLDFTKLRLQPCFSPSGPLLFGCTLVYMAVLRLFWPVGPPPPPKQRLSPVLR